MATAQKTQASTQKFTEIVDIVGNTVVLTGGHACMIIELTASNFALLSHSEQEVRIGAFASLLNALSFPIQIVIRNKHMDISSYLHDLDAMIKTTQNENLKEYMQYYRAFVQEMMTVNVVLNKAFYVVLSYSSLESGAGGVSTQLPGKATVDSFAQKARNALEIKANAILSHLQRFAVSAKVLDKKELIELFYDLYNDGQKIELDTTQGGIHSAIITTGGDTP